jgi:hypothetical protein
MFQAPQRLASGKQPDPAAARQRTVFKIKSSGSIATSVCSTLKEWAANWGVFMSLHVTDLGRACMGLSSKRHACTLK